MRPRLTALNRVTLPAVVLILLDVAAAWPAPTHAEVQARFSGLRVPFIANESQVDGRVAYYAPTSAGTLFVTRRGEMVYSLPGPSAPKPGWTLTETFRGGRATPSAHARSATNVSFFLGDDPTRWRHEVSTYEEVNLGEVWPGVTVSLRAHGRSIEKVFTVHPRASVGRIRVRVGGADALSVDSRGALVARTGLGPVTFTPPVAYQERDGIRRSVAVAYRRHGHGYGFTVGPYDRALPLVIDPLLQSTYLGGGGYDYGHTVAIHPTGDVYMAGDTGSSNFPGTIGGAQPINAGGGNAFVARLSNGLTTLVQATYLGGVFGAAAAALAINPTTGDVYLGGNTYGGFPGTAGGAQSAYAGNEDGFVARLSSTLTTLIQATYLGGSSVERVVTLAIAPMTHIGGPGGDVYAGGGTFSADLPGTIGGAQSTNAGNEDGFVARLSSGLTTLIRATCLGGTGFERIWALALAPTTGDVYVTGETASTDLPGRTGGAQSTLAGSGDAFAARLSSSLTTLLQSTYLGGSFPDVGHAIAIAPTTGDVYVTGYTESSDFPNKRRVATFAARR